MEGDGASWSRAGTGSWVRGGWQLDGFHLARELRRVLGRGAYGARRQRGGGARSRQNCRRAARDRRRPRTSARLQPLGRPLR